MLTNWILYFFIYSFFGWVCECIYCGVPAKKFINRGFLAGPYCPIYGCGALTVIYTLTPYTQNPVILFGMGVVFTSALEYITSYVMEKLFHTKWWDYSKHPFNIHGRICLKNSILFGLMVLVVCYGIHPGIVDVVSLIPEMMRHVLVIIISVAFLYDGYTTVYALLRKNVDFNEIENSIKELREAFKNANLFPLTQPLTEKVQQVLDSTNADEILLAHIEKLRMKFDNFYQKRKFTYDRLSQAFPNRIEAISRKNAERLFEIITRHKEDR